MTAHGLHVCLTRKCKNACNSNGTMADSDFYFTSSTGIKTDMSGLVQAASTGSSLENIESAAKFIVKLQRWTRIPLTFDLKPVEPFPDFRVLISSSPVHAISSLEQPFYIAPPHSKKSRIIIIAKTNNLMQRTANTVKYKDILTQNDVRASCDP